MKKIALKEIDKKVKEGWIHTKFIIEIAGRPKEHIAETLKQVIDKFWKEKGVREISEEINKPRKLGEKFWSTFVEIEFLADRIGTILGLIYDYLPSSIEIIAPEDAINEDPLHLSELLNDLIAKLHMYDMSLKKLQSQNILLRRQIAQNSPSK